MGGLFPPLLNGGTKSLKSEVLHAEAHKAGHSNRRMMKWNMVAYL